MKFKESDILASQVRAAEEAIGEKMLPESKVQEELGVSLEDLKEKYPLRYDLCYDLYLKVLRKEKLTDEDNEQISKVKETLGRLNSLDSYIGKHRTSTEQEQLLRPRQFGVFQDLRDFLEEGNKKGYVKLPTGVGKTVVFIEFIKALKSKTLVVVPTNVLVNQTRKRFEQFAPDLDVGQINQDEKKQGKNATVITYDSLLQGYRSGTISPEDFDLIVYDEVHEALGPQTVKMLDDDAFQHPVQIGFTATPKYAEDKQVANILPTEIHSMEIQEAVEEGLLSGFRVIVARTDVDISNVKVTASGEYSEKELDKFINTEARNRGAVEIYKKMFMGEKVVCYCNSVAHAKRVSEIFQSEGINVEAVWGEQARTAAGKEQQRASIEKLAAGEIMGISNARMLIAGWDDPTVKVCFNLTPTQSLVDAEQRGGRVLRLLGDARATIVDFLDKTSYEKFPVTFAEIANATAIPPAESNPSTSSKKSSAETAESPQIAIEGWEIMTDSKEVLRLVKDATDKKYKVAPSDWISVEEIALQTRRRRSTVMSYVKALYRQKHEGDKADQELFGRFRNAETGAFEVFVEPKSADRVMADIEEVRKQKNAIVPKDWIPSREMDRTQPFMVQAIGHANRRFGLGDMRQFLGPEGKYIKYISPAAQAWIEKARQAIQKQHEYEKIEQGHGSTADQVVERVRNVFPIADEEADRFRKILESKIAGGIIVSIEKEKDAIVLTRQTPSGTKNLMYIRALQGKNLDQARYNKALAEYNALPPDQKSTAKKPAFGDFMVESTSLKLS